MRELESPATFTPLRSASRSRRIIVFVVGPLLWFVAVVLVGLVVHRSGAVELGLAVTLISLLVSLLICAIALWLRRRDDRKAAEA